MSYTVLLKNSSIKILGRKISGREPNRITQTWMNFPVLRSVTCPGISKILFLDWILCFGCTKFICAEVYENFRNLCRSSRARAHPCRSSVTRFPSNFLKLDQTGSVYPFCFKHWAFSCFLMFAADSISKILKHMKMNGNKNWHNKYVLTLHHIHWTNLSD